MSFLNSIKNNSSKHKIPFDHWEYSEALSEGSIEEIMMFMRHTELCGECHASIIFSLFEPVW